MEDLVDQFVILKPEYWDLHYNSVEGYRINAQGNPQPADLRMPDVDFSSVDGVEKITPRIGQVEAIRDFEIEGKTVRRAVVCTSFYFPRARHGDFELIDPSWLTTFKVVLRPDAVVDEDGCLGHPEDGIFGEIVESTTDPDNAIFWVREIHSGMETDYDTHELLFLPDDKYEVLKAAKPLVGVSKTGFLPPEIPNNIQHVVFSQLSGLHSRYTPQSAINSIRNWLYGPPQTVYPEPEPELNALNAGPLPYGPTEENFAGGSRNSRSIVGTQMARRGTRRSRGIFSRLYSPVGHLLAAGKESVGAVTNTAKGVVGEGIKGLDKIGRSVTSHANMAVKNVLTRKGGKRRGSRKSRKSRRTTRRRR